MGFLMAKRIVFWLLLLVVSLSAFVDGGLVRRLAFLLMIFFVLIHGSKKGVNLKKSEFFIGFFCCWVVATCYWGVAPTIISSIIADYIGFMACMVVAGRFADSGINAFKYISISYVFGALIASWMVIKSWVIGESFDDSGRFTAGELNANYIAYTVSSAFPILAILSFEKTIKRNFFKFLVFSGIAVFMIFAVSLTGSRGGLISSLSVIIFWMFKLFNKKIIKLFVFLILIVPIFVVMISFLPDPIKMRLVMTSDGSDTESFMTGRDAIWDRAFNLIYSDPVIGSGVGSFQFLNDGVATHNVILGLLLDTGIIGLFLYLSWLFHALFSKRELGMNSLSFSNSVFLVSWIPIAMTGVWIISPAMCFVVALVASRPARRL